VKAGIVLRVAAGAVFAILAAEPLLVAGDDNQRSAVALLAILPVVLAAVALVLPRSPFGMLAGVAFIGEYAVALSLGDVAVDQAAPLLGVGLLAGMELLDAIPPRRRTPIRVDGQLRQARLVRWLLAGAAALTAGAIAIAATAASSAGDDAALRTLGMGAAALAIALPVIVARRMVGSRRTRLFGEDSR
jgi:hypothetical protein